MKRCQHPRYPRYETTVIVDHTEEVLDTEFGIWCLEINQVPDTGGQRADTVFIDQVAKVLDFRLTEGTLLLSLVPRAEGRPKANRTAEQFLKPPSSGIPLLQCEVFLRPGVLVAHGGVDQWFECSV